MGRDALGEFEHQLLLAILQHGGNSYTWRTAVRAADGPRKGFNPPPTVCIVTFYSSPLLRTMGG